ncbi:MAG: pilus assembly protein PilP [Deltaproteobacteria bacterium]|nr:MAG: pilus assembly protein PilP [Deltaproteobacteria bacterium]
MKDKRTIIFAVILLTMVGVYVWHANRIRSKRITEDKVTRKVPLAPEQVAMKKVVNALRAYKKEKGTYPRSLDALKGNYLDARAYEEAKERKLLYAYVNPEAYRLTAPTLTRTQVAKATKTKTKKPGAAASPATTSESATKKLAVMETGWKYDPQGKPDPFKPFIVASRTPDATPEVKRQPLTPLQKMPLSEIQAGLKAIIWGQLGSKALVEDATGKGYVVQVGTYVGQNDGIVKKIFEDRIVVEEYRRDRVENRLVTNEVVLKLKKGEEAEE